MGSSRLPGKVLKPILGKPMLALQIERIKRSLLIDEVVIATTTESQDDAIERLAEDLDVGCYRGSENDVLLRVTEASRKFNIDINVEFMGDSPIPDPMLVDSMIGYFLKNSGDFDYLTNSLTTTYPPGVEVCIYSSEVLYDAEDKAVNDELREHVGPNIYLNPDRYRLRNLEAPPWFHYPELYIEVDTAEDFEVISAIYQHFYESNPGFGLAQVIEFMLAHPDLADLNSRVERRWKVFRQE